MSRVVGRAAEECRILDRREVPRKDGEKRVRAAAGQGVSAVEHREVARVGAAGDDKVERGRVYAQGIGEIVAVPAHVYRALERGQILVHARHENVVIAAIESAPERHQIGYREIQGGGVPRNEHANVEGAVLGIFHRGRHVLPGAAEVRRSQQRVYHERQGRIIIRQVKFERLARNRVADRDVLAAGRRFLVSHRRAEPHGAHFRQNAQAPVGGNLDAPGAFQLHEDLAGIGAGRQGEHLFHAAAVRAKTKAYPRIHLAKLNLLYHGQVRAPLA